jgi:hypothetical protein
MPYYLRHLSQRSLDVYTRIHRLDTMAYGKLSKGTVAYDA